MANQSIKWMSVMVLVLVGMVAGERTKNCDIYPSPRPQDFNKVDVHCNCMQRLTDIDDLQISQLTINQTSCAETGLELSWPDLETLVAPETLVLEGAKVFFARRTRPAVPWTPSIKTVLFLDCAFESLPSIAFRGMRLLAEVKIIGGSIGVLKSNAFSSLPELKKVEIANTTIDVIENKAFTDLPALQDLFIVNSNIREIESEAIYLNKPTKDGEAKRCLDLSRDAFDDGSVLQGVVGRELTTVTSLSLPEYGSRILLFKNSIEIINTVAIKADTFGFLIVGGNFIGRLSNQAFSMELYNECEISAALFVGNVFGRLDSSALTGLRGRDGMANQTFIALSNNTFLTVLQQGFMLHQSLVIFSIEENRFDCQCDKFDWILGNDEATDTQRDLEKELVLEALCLDGSMLLSYSSSCGSVNSSTTPTTHSPPTTPHTEPFSTPALPTPSSAMEASVNVAACVLTLVVGKILA